MSSNEAGVTELKRGYRKTREGLVVSDKMDKTVVVAVEDRFKLRPSEHRNPDLLGPTNL